MTKQVDPRSKFLKLIDLNRSRVLLAPHITFICGGPVDITATTNHSVRNMFMNASAEISDKSEGFVLAENFKDWQTGYSNLSDFENDIASLSSIIVIILESPGSLAELGLFYANEKLRQKMIVVVHREHHQSESFIKFGLLDPLEAIKDEAVLVYEIDSADVDQIKMEEVQDIVKEVLQISDGIDDSSHFDRENLGHVIFLIFQIVDLFSILTAGELRNYLKEMNIDLPQKRISSALYILEKFRLIIGEKRSSQTFFFIPPEISDRVDFVFTLDDTDPENVRRYDARAIKLEVFGHYETRRKENPSFNNRLKILDRRAEEN